MRPPQRERPEGPASGASVRPAFTLVELLVVIAIVAVLVSLVMPALRQARQSARLVATHAQLAQIELSLSVYGNDQRNALPPTRSGCSFRRAYEPPPELAEGGYLPSVEEGGVVRVAMGDAFTGGYFRYRAPGPVVMNEVSVFVGDQGSKLYVPDRYPTVLDEPGRYHVNPETSPIRYAIWSMGPNPESSKFNSNPGRGPALRRFWLVNAGQEGVVAHLIGNRFPDVRSP